LLFQRTYFRLFDAHLGVERHLLDHKVPLDLALLDLLTHIDVGDLDELVLRNLALHYGLVFGDPRALSYSFLLILDFRTLCLPGG